MLCCLCYRSVHGLSLTPGWWPVAGKAKKMAAPTEVRVQPEILLQRISRSLSVISCRVYILQMSTKNLAEAGPCFGLSAGRIIRWSRVNTSRRPEVLVMVQPMISVSEFSTSSCPVFLSSALYITPKALYRFSRSVFVLRLMLLHLCEQRSRGQSQAGPQSPPISAGLPGAF